MNQVQCPETIGLACIGHPDCPHGKPHLKDSLYVPCDGAFGCPACVSVPAEKTAASSEPSPALRKGQILVALKKLKLRKEELSEALHHVRETETFLREEYTLITRREAEANALKLEAVETVEKLLQKVASQLREKDLADLMEDYSD